MNLERKVTLFEPLQGRRSFEEVAARIRQQVAQGNLREGDRLPPERDLAATFGVSRNTVREALRALEHAGILTQKPGVTGGALISSSGASVIKTALGDLVRLGSIGAADLTEARIIIGREVARLACERHDAADYAALAENVARTRQAAAEGNQPIRVAHSLEFHKLLSAAAKNPVLSLLTGALTDMTTEFVRVIGMMPNEFVVSSRERTLQYLKARDAGAAAQEMEDYLKTTLKNYLDRPA